MSAEQEQAWQQHVASKRNIRNARKSSFVAGWEAALKHAAEGGLLEQRLAQVAQLHYEIQYSFASDPGCHECGEDWPCNTIQALEAK